MLYLTRNFVYLLRYRVHLHPQLGCCLVHQVYCLVGQIAVGYIAVAQFDGCNYGAVLDSHMVMCLILLFQSAQYRDGAQCVRLIDLDYLEAAFQGFVFLEVLLVFVESCRADGSQFSTGQCRLEDVGCIHCSFAFACPHESVYLIDEEYYLALGLDDFVDDRFESFLKLAFVLCSCDEGSHVE